VAAEDLRINWGALSSALTVTNLNSLADGNIWLSAAINDAEPHNEFVQLSYTIEFNATPIAGDYLEIFLPKGNGDGTILWPGGASDSEQALTAAAAKAEFLQACRPVARHEWATSHGAIFKNVLTLALRSPDFRFGVRAVGEAIKSTGNTVKYKLGTYQRQTS
jgi:hypothetical protein